MLWNQNEHKILTTLYTVFCAKILQLKLDYCYFWPEIILTTPY